MSKHILKVLDTEMLTHNVKRFTVEKPAGFIYIPGQATELAINKPGLENEFRPFTFTSLPGENTLEFVIKMYTGHNGMTENLARVNAGDEFILNDVFGTISYKGPGLFIAAGAGITPFIAIFRNLYEKNALGGNTLLFANRTEEDIILKDELKKMLGDNFINIIEKGKDENEPPKFIDKKLIAQHYRKELNYYICGPEKFTLTMVNYLLELGADKSIIIIEQ
jgi:ferredoxin-NADP reductase